MSYKRLTLQKEKELQLKDLNEAHAEIQDLREQLREIHTQQIEELDRDS